MINPLDIGRLDKRITFRKIADGTDAVGQNTQEWQDYKTVWATVKALRGGEYFEAQMIRPEKTYKITVRYMPDVTEDMQITYAGKTLEIGYINDVEEARYMLEILATEYIEKVTEDAEVGADTEGGEPYG
jgi:SPP1 family predicted phage head-tail adaptor